jgi:ribosomal protein L37AE/L43A
MTERERNEKLDASNDLEWLHRFLNASTFGAPPSEIQRAHRIVDALKSAIAEVTEVCAIEIRHEGADVCAACGAAALKLSMRDHDLLIWDCLSCGSSLANDVIVKMNALLSRARSATERAQPVAWLYEAEGFADAFSKTRLPISRMFGNPKETPLYSRDDIQGSQQ